jgi:putative sigma-54 modulation protein
MQVDIQALNFALTDALRHHIERRLAFALSARDEHIHRVTVRLTDINGPKGGRDMCCHIQVALKGLPDVVVKDTEADLHAAIDRAAERASRTVIRQLERKVDRERWVDPYERNHSSIIDKPIGDLTA